LDILIFLIRNGGENKVANVLSFFLTSAFYPNKAF